MSKEDRINDNEYIILLKYFKGDIINLTAKKIKDLKAGVFNGEPVEPIDKKISNRFIRILKLKKSDPEKYASKRWIYPEWKDNKEEEEKRLKGEEEEEEVKEEVEEVEEEEGKEKYSYEDQVKILTQFYQKVDPGKKQETILKIINDRRQKGSPKGSPIPYQPWIELCAKLENKYNINPLLEKEEEVKPEIEEISDDIFKGIIPQRKAFIDWMNDSFYREQIENYKNYLKSIPIPESEDEEKNLRILKIYQFFVREYLSIETPFRGLLVYHGLGTGKTATSVITAEGLSKTMPIFTFLPASLETEFIKEVRGWGDVLFNIDKNNWIFFPLQEIKGDLNLRKMLDTVYGISEKKINQILNNTKAKIKKTLTEGTDYKSIVQELNKINGIYLQSPSLEDENRTIYTSTGEPILKEGESFNGECLKLKPEQKIFIDEEINLLIQLKYNFIHYNGFPKVHEVNFREQVDEELFEDDDEGTDNQKKVKYFVKKYQENVKDYGVLSPFRENVIIIDEVHNFVNEIMNGSAPANVFYDWIINSEDVKIVFLSGTPVINKPAEIAILFNMLRGALQVYEFSVISSRDDYELEQELRDHFYKERSSIEQLHVSKKKGKLILSFIKNKTNYESILENGVIKTIQFNNHTLEEFLNEINDGLEKFFDKGMVIPSREQLKKVSLLDIKKGIPKIFDEDIQLIFNRKQRLFDIYENDMILDLTKNENFMEYFFDDQFNIPERKQVLLRRMLLGMTSYYPIDRSSITTMPEIVKPRIIERYKDYKIVKNINIIPCFMTSNQWVKYEEEYTREKLKRLQQMRKKDIYSDASFDYNIRTRQNSNIVYEDDSFRKDGDDEKKEEVYDMMTRNGHFSYEKTLGLFSPKFFNILTNMRRFIDKGIPTGKILYYSDFRHEAGSEVFERILIANGYEKYQDDIDDLIANQSIKKRYTFITGKESQEQRRLNKEAFNHPKNLRGEYIHIILISSSGAEGISLKCVRQVHIMEPFWNYIRVDQVLGRAARMESHISLPEDERNVEQYLYLAMLPEGNTVEEIFDSLKALEWAELDGIQIAENVKDTLVNQHKNIYKTITKLLSMKKSTNDRSVDQVLFDIMEKKHNISMKITDLIKESSVDCIQNTRDDIQLNEKCLRFSKKLNEEASHFPGITSSQLNTIDQKQFKANFTFFIEPDIYVVLAKRDSNDLFIYYRIQDIGEDIDIRYIRENGYRLCDYEPFRQKLIVYEKRDHPLNDKLGVKFSVFQSIFNVPDYIVETKIEKSVFPRIEEIIEYDNLEALIIKHNVSERLFYSPISGTNIIKLYDYIDYKENQYSIENSESLIIRNGKLFKSYR